MQWQIIRPECRLYARTKYLHPHGAARSFILAIGDEEPDVSFDRVFNLVAERFVGDVDEDATPFLPEFGGEGLGARYVGGGGGTEIELGTMKRTIRGEGVR